jgi:hypothetical protein
MNKHNVKFYRTYKTYKTYKKRMGKLFSLPIRTVTVGLVYRHVLSQCLGADLRLII